MLVRVTGGDARRTPGEEHGSAHEKGQLEGGKDQDGTQQNSAHCDAPRCCVQLHERRPDKLMRLFSCYAS